MKSIKLVSQFTKKRKKKKKHKTKKKTKPFETSIDRVPVFITKQEKYVDEEEAVLICHHLL